MASTSQSGSRTAVMYANVGTAASAQMSMTERGAIVMRRAGCAGAKVSIMKSTVRSTVSSGESAIEIPAAVMASRVMAAADAAEAATVVPAAETTEAAAVVSAAETPKASTMMAPAAEAPTVSPTVAAATMSPAAMTMREREHRRRQRDSDHK